MKTIAVVDAGSASLAFYEKYFADVRAASGAEKILVITDGDISREGTLSSADKYDRAAMFHAAGASAVVEMPLCGMLLAENVYAFAVTCMLQKLENVQQIAIPYTGGSEALFEKITSFLFDEPLPYQQQMRALRSVGRELRRELPRVMEHFVPGAEDFLRVRSNHLSVEMYNTLRRAYFPAKPVLISVSGLPEEAAPQDRFLGACLKQKFLAQPAEETLKWSVSRYFGNERIDRRVLDALSDGAEDIVEISRRAELPGAHAVTIRWHLIACLTGYRKVDSFVCIMYNYIPYIRLIGAADADFRRNLTETAGTTLLIDTPEEQDFSQLTDAAKALLNDIDRRARELFLEAKQR